LFISTVNSGDLVSCNVSDGVDSTEVTVCIELTGTEESWSVVKSTGQDIAIVKLVAGDGGLGELFTTEVLTECCSDETTEY
jgi:hypothetical protein